MKKPILFSTLMVQAILDGRKSQTRRIIKPQPELCHGCQSCEFRCDHFLISPKRVWSVGDKLWVRETWAQTKSGDYIYRANYHPDDPTMGFISWKPSIHMPALACRIYLQVSGVRVERLQNISRADAYCEGIEKEGLNKNPIFSFQCLWESINGIGSWSVNPWCWVISFKKLDN